MMPKVCVFLLLSVLWKRKTKQTPIANKLTISADGNQPPTRQWYQNFDLFWWRLVLGFLRYCVELRIMISLCSPMGLFWTFQDDWLESLLRRVGQTCNKRVSLIHMKLTAKVLRIFGTFRSQIFRECITTKRKQNFQVVEHFVEIQVHQGLFIA